ncbi:MAG: hypothetical protein ACR2MG_11655, partial [Pyrinomonadaceae bacterium]
MTKDTNTNFLETPTIVETLSKLIANPVQNILLRWNWKSALLSAIIRSSIYLTTYLVRKEGLKSAFGAMAVEFVMRSFTAGISGSLIQAFRRAKPAWLATFTVMIILPFISHSVEFSTHYIHEFTISQLYSTPMIESTRKSSFYFSVAFSILSVIFNMFAVKRGVLIVGKGEGQQSLWKDIKQMPTIVAEFLAFPFVWLRREVKVNTNRTASHLSESPEGFP